MQAVDVYVDGSYSKARPGICRGAAVILVDGKPVYAQNYIIQKSAFVSMNNVGGELWAAISAIQIVQGLFKDEPVLLTIYHDYKGIRNFVQGPEKWTPKKDGAVMYTYVMQEYIKSHPESTLAFKKVAAHTGDKWNEIVDDLSRGDVSSEINDVYKGCMTFKE